MSKKILIFGGTGAIGYSIAKKMSVDGYSPVIISRNKEELIDKSEKISCDYEICDVLNNNQIEEISKKYNDEVFGLAYCVGSINLKPLKISKDEDFINSFKINTLGAVNAIKSNLQTLTKNNGSILLFSTVAVQQGFTNHSVVSSSKGAIEGLTLSLAAEFSPKIRVNCIAPSLTDSKMSQKMISNETIRKAIENMHPIPKIGQGEDFGDLSSFLLSEKNNWITGQIFHIDGGRSTLRIKA
ncbi:SDR family oxidoreductase [Pelagibacterales bacterium SAG-MED31]|nr:SDR family oxidoreductase [Pelagibacterales bacterium SAG-MED31]